MTPIYLHSRRPRRPLAVRIRQWLLTPQWWCLPAAVAILAGGVTAIFRLFV